MASPDPNQKIEDGTFLAEQFDIPPRKAAKLVSNGGDAGKVEAGVHEKLRSSDALEDVPAPKASDDFTADTDETQLKPVLRNKNNRTGAG